MRNRYRKERRLLLLLLLMFVMVFCLWLEAGKPSLSPQGALRKAEQSGLLEYGSFLTAAFDFSAEEQEIVHYTPAVSRSGSQLHVVELARRTLLWQPNDRALAVPVEDPVTALLLPWQINIESDDSCYPAVLVYCPEGADVTATMTIAGEEVPSRTFSGRTGRGDRGCWLVAFENLYSKENQPYLFVFQRLESYYRYHRALRASSITVEITVFDRDGAVLSQKTLTY